MRTKPKAALVQPDMLDSRMDVFLGGGAADAAAAPPKPAPASGPRPEYAPRPTVQKLFRLREDTCHGLRGAAISASAKEGRRVTETEIVERLIRRHLKMDK